MQSKAAVIVNLRFTNTCDVVCDRRSIFGNPYEMGRDGTRDEVCDMFIPYFTEKLKNEEFRKKVLALRGKVLACWCVPKRCHVETIVEFLNKNI